MARAPAFMNYVPKPDRYDEAFDTEGRPRGHWERLALAAHRASRAALSRRAQTIRRAVEQHGVTYNIYGDPQGADRPWEVDVLPFVIGKEEWHFLANAIAAAGARPESGDGRFIWRKSLAERRAHPACDYLWTQ